MARQGLLGQRDDAPASATPSQPSTETTTRRREPALRLLLDSLTQARRTQTRRSSDRPETSSRHSPTKASREPSHSRAPSASEGRGYSQRWSISAPTMVWRSHLGAGAPLFRHATSASPSASTRPAMNWSRARQRLAVARRSRTTQAVSRSGGGSGTGPTRSGFRLTLVGSDMTPEAITEGANGPPDRETTHVP